MALSLLGGKGTFGAGSWCNFVPYRQRNDMDLFVGFAMGRFGLILIVNIVFPAGNNGWLSQISRAVCISADPSLTAQKEEAQMNSVSTLP